MILSLLLACLPLPEQPDPRALLLEDTAEPVAASPRAVFVGLGQSNLCGTVPRPAVFAHSLVGDHLGATVIRNGVELLEYGAPTGSPVVGPEPFLVDELVLEGFDPADLVVITRCTNGSAITHNRDVLVPLLVEDLAERQLPAPIGILYWQGEADARSMSLAPNYEPKLTGSDGQASLRGAVEDVWPDILWAVVELRVRDPDYAPIAGQELVRAAQHSFGAWPGVCVVPSYDAPLSPGDNQPHVSLVGTEILARRAVHGWLDSFCP